MDKISDERLAQLIANASGAADETWWLDDVADALTELQSLRSQPASDHVADAGKKVVADAMVERAMASINGEPDLFITEGAMRWALTAALS